MHFEGHQPTRQWFVPKNPLAVLFDCYCEPPYCGSISKRTAIRIALGAQRFQVIRSTLSRPVLILLRGSCLGLIGGVLAARVLAHLISFASTRDPLVLAGVVLTMMLLGPVATWIPAAARSPSIPQASCAIHKAMATT